MRYLSLFSGIEAVTVAWHSLGFEPAAFAEIAPFPSAVLAHHYPDVPNLGDVTAITENQIKNLGHIDIVVGGSPCQDLSIAGKRNGLAGERSGLFHEQIRIFNAARHFCGARFLLWENVPGAFSTNNGRDFAVVVGTMAGCQFDVPKDGWGTEGVALGNNGLVEWAVLDAQWFGVAQRRRRVFALLDTGDWRDRPPILLERDSLRGNSPPRRCKGTGTTAVPAPSIGNESSHPLIAMAHGQAGAEIATDRSPSLTCNHEAPIIAYGFQPRIARNGRGDMGEVVNALTAQAGETGKGDAAPCVATVMQARRLTPRECERLQGFPDDYTLIPVSSAKMAADGPRYKALGNSMAVPVMRWIGQKLKQITEGNIT